MKLLGKHKGIIISLLVTLGIVAYFYRALVLVPGIMSHYDYVWFFLNLEEGGVYNQWFQTWNSTNIVMGPRFGFEMLFSPIYFILSKLVIPTPSVYLFGLLLLGSLIGYFFVYYYTRNIYASTAAGTLYSISWLIEGIYEHMPMMTGYVLMPILFLLFDRALVKGRYRDIVYFALFAFAFVTLVHQHNTYLALALLSLFALARLTLARDANFFARFARISKVSLLAVVMVLGLAFYQIMPLLAGAKTYFIGLTYGLEEAAYLSTPLFAKFALVTNRWTVAFASSYFILGTVLAALAFSALLIRRNLYTVFFAAVALVCIFLAKGPLPPFTSLFNLLWDNFPFFDTFRQAHRWLMITSLAYLFLLGVSLKYITDTLKASPRIKFVWGWQLLSIILTGMVLVTILLSTKPLFNPYDVKGFDPSQYPEYREAREAYALIGSRHEDTYTTFLVLQNTLVLDKNLSHPTETMVLHQTANPIGWLYPESRQPVLRLHETWQNLQASGFNRFIDYQTERRTMTNLTQILGSENIKYIVVDKAKQGSYVDFFQRQDNNQLIYEGETLVVFENENALPHLYATPASAKLLGGLNSLSGLQFIPSFSFDAVDLLPSGSSQDNDFLILYDTDAEQFLMLNADKLEGVQRLDLDKYGKIPWWRQPGRQELDYWSLSDWWYAQGEFVLDHFHLRTGGQNTIEIPFSVDESNNYEMWLRIAYASDRGNLDVLVDGKELPHFPLTPEADFNYGFKFVKAPLSLGEGEHILELRNDGSGYNDVDEVLLIKSSTLNSVFSNMTKGIPAKIVYFAELEKLSDFNNRGDWSLYDYGGQGKIITDDEQTRFWKVWDPEQVKISDSSSNRQTGTDSLMVEVNGQREYWTVLSHHFSDLQDWADQDRISFYFYGNNTGGGFSLSVITDKEKENTSFSWRDNFIGWRQFTLLIDKQKMDWSRVRWVKIGITERDASGTWFFDDFQTAKSHGPVVKLIKSIEKMSTISADFRPLKEGKYMLAIRALASDTQREITKYTPHIIVADDEQPQFWTVPDPQQVHISDSTDIKEHGTKSLRIEVSGQREFLTILDHRFSEPQDWSEQDLISFYFYGQNTGHNFVLAMEALDYQGIEKSYWKDDFTGWRQFTFTLDKEKDWTQVKRLVIGILENPANGTWYFDNLTLGRMDIETIGYTPEESKLHVTIGSESITFGDGDSNRFTSEFGWLETGPVSLDAKSQTMELSNEGKVLIDKLLLYPYESQADLDSLFQADNDIFLNFEKLSPTKYQIHVNTDKPFWLVFTEIYHPLWYAHTNEESIPSTETYLGLNSFYISKTGEYDFLLEFKGQQYLKYGAIISLLTLSFMVLGGVFAERHNKRKKRINR